MAKKIDVNGLDHFKEKENAMIASEYSSSKTYAVGEYAYHAGTLYKCTTAITTAEAWTSGHWTAAQLANDVTDLNAKVKQLNGISGVTKTVENVAVASFDDGTASAVKQIVVGIEPVQSGSGDPAPDNVRPITGWTGTNVYKANKNIGNCYGYSASSAAYRKNQTRALTNSYGTTLSAVDFDENTPLVVTQTAYSAQTPTSYQNGYFIICFDGLKIEQTYKFTAKINITNNPLNVTETRILGNSVIAAPVSIENGVISGTFSLPTNSDRHIIEFRCAGLSFSLWDIMITEANETDAEYEPYTGTTIPITFPSEAGTVYGATLENHGTDQWKLRVEWADVDMGELNWSALGSSYPNVFYTSIAGKANGQFNIISSYYKTSNVGTLANIPDKSIVANSLGTTVYAKDTNYSDASLFKQSISGQQIVYELSTPVEYTFTTSEVIQLLAGYNNVWADTGDIELLEYYADSKTYIDEENALVKALIAKELPSMVADTALVKNDFRIVNNTLYKVTTSIASGATLTVGTNVVATTLAEVIKLLLS